MSKKIVGILLVLLIACVGCGKKTDVAEETVTVELEEVEIVEEQELPVEETEEVSAVTEEAVEEVIVDAEDIEETVE